MTDKTALDFFDMEKFMRIYPLIRDSWWGRTTNLVEVEGKKRMKPPPEKGHGIALFANHEGLPPNLAKQLEHRNTLMGTVGLGWVVVDTDDDEATKIAQATLPPPAVKVKSGKGYHYYYRLNNEEAKRHLTGKRDKTPAYDILASQNEDGRLTTPKFVYLPGSYHPVTKTHYEVVEINDTAPVQVFTAIEQFKANCAKWAGEEIPIELPPVQRGRSKRNIKADIARAHKYCAALEDVGWQAKAQTTPARKEGHCPVCKERTGDAGDDRLHFDFNAGRFGCRVCASKGIIEKDFMSALDAYINDSQHKKFKEKTKDRAGEIDSQSECPIGSMGDLQFHFSLSCHAAYNSSNPKERPKASVYANLFVKYFEDCVKYILEDKLFVVWDVDGGTGWREDRDSIRVKNILMDAIPEFNTVETHIKIIQSNDCIATHAEEWDNEHSITAFSDGTCINQRGERRSVTHEDRIRKPLPISPEDGEPDVWLKFLKSLYPDTPGMIDFMGNFIAYSGFARHDKDLIAFFQGIAGSGKSTIKRVLKHIFHGKIAMVDKTTVTGEKGASTENGLESLVGKQIGFIEEANESEITPSILKSLSSYDTHVVRSKYKGQREDSLNAQLIFISNQLPVMGALDSGMRRRCMVVPFNHSFEGHPDKDTKLIDKLIDEAPRILNWILSYLPTFDAYDFFSVDLVRESTLEYLDTWDLLGQFIEDTFYVTGSDKDFIPLGILTKDYNAWREVEGFKAVSPHTVRNLMIDKGFKVKRRRYTLDGIETRRECVLNLEWTDGKLRPAALAIEVHHDKSHTIN